MLWSDHVKESTPPRITEFPPRHDLIILGHCLHLLTQNCLPKRKIQKYCGLRRLLVIQF